MLSRTQIKKTVNKPISYGMRLRRLQLADFARRAATNIEIGLGEFFGPRHPLSNIKVNFQFCNEKTIKGFIMQADLPGKLQEHLKDIGSKMVVPAIEIINKNKNIFSLFNLGDKGAICGLFTDGETVGRYGIYKYASLLARLVIATPKAFELLNQDELLLRRLQDHLILTGTINLQLLVKAGFDTTRFRANTHEPCRFFGVNLPEKKDKEIFKSAISALERDTGKAAAAFYKAAGINCKDIECLNQQQIKSLGKKIRGPLKNSAVGSIALTDRPFDFIIVNGGDGKSKFELSRRQLETSNEPSLELSIDGQEDAN